MLAPWILKIQSSRTDLDAVQQCSIQNLKANLSFLDHASAIEPSEFLARRDRLAQALHRSNVSAFILEPGYTFQYYANISQFDWEPWEPEERPFLMVVRPQVSRNGDRISAHTSFLAPHFEEGRVRMLGIPSRGDLEIVTWEEHWNPYLTLREGAFNNLEGVKVMVDEEMRDYIVRGLSSVGFETVGLDANVDAVRQQKSPAEVEILRAVNTGTVEALRAMRPCLVPGLTENQVMEILDNSMRSIGFKPFFDIVLFEENAALPHGGFATGDKVLTQDTMVLIDVGAHYLGYSSDVCRSFFIDPPSRRNMIHRILPFIQWPQARGCNQQTSTRDQDLHELKLKIWDLVLDAQDASINQFKPNATAASVDIAARSVIDAAGYEKYFTHRVGHGIGIKAHESPYLNKGNHESLLLPGMTFTSEPGVYLTNQFGVRHEDVFLVQESGEAACLSGRRARGPYDP